MALGRGLTEAEEREHSQVTVISYRFWQEAFARDPEALGKTLYIKGDAFTIVGVTAPSFLGVSYSGAMDFWIPLQTRPELNAWGEPATDTARLGSPKWWDIPMLARLRPGILPDQAQRILQPTFWQAASEGIGTLDPKRWPAHLGFEPVRGIPGAADHYRTSLEIMMALVGLVLLIACTNVALLIIARNSVRQREFAVRMAVGARASRIFRQLLTESVLLVSAGGRAGLGAGRRSNAGFGSLGPDRCRSFSRLACAVFYRRRRIVVGSHLLACSPARHHAHRHRTGTEEQQPEHEPKPRPGPGRQRGHGVANRHVPRTAGGLVAHRAQPLELRAAGPGMQAQSLLVFDVTPQNISSDAAGTRLLSPSARSHPGDSRRPGRIAGPQPAWLGLDTPPKALPWTESSRATRPAHVWRPTTTMSAPDSFRPWASPCCKAAALPARTQRTGQVLWWSMRSSFGASSKTER